MTRYKTIFTILIFSVLLLFIILLVVGPVTIPIDSFWDILFDNNSVPKSWKAIFWEIRFPKTVTAFMAGAALAVSGLIMQTYFGNPLAGPFILGVHSGASLGVAFWIMATGVAGLILPEIFHDMGLILFAVLGSSLVLFLLLFLSRKIPGKLVLLVMGLVFGHMAGGIINILVSISSADKIRTFLLWNLGSFQRVTGNQLVIFTLVILLGLIISIFLIKHLNLLLLGEHYARTSGMNVERLKIFFILLTALLSGTVTAFCGPIAFVGIITPHMLRRWILSNNHSFLLPGCMLLGGCMAMFAEFVSNFFGTVTIPINAVMGLIGAPVIFLFLWKRKIVEES
ncbi:MAG: iron ABC transporter permease [Bacteriovoracaceae bacterium]|nr:iron ABC transporter permease [Bacteriovoracaceae bacterium]